MCVSELLGIVAVRVVCSSRSSSILSLLLCVCVCTRKKFTNISNEHLHNSLPISLLLLIVYIYIVYNLFTTVTTTISTHFRLQHSNISNTYNTKHQLIFMMLMMLLCYVCDKCCLRCGDVLKWLTKNPASSDYNSPRAEELLGSKFFFYWVDRFLYLFLCGIVMTV